MKFWLIYIGFNVLVFLSFYILNFRNQSNPFFFLVDKGLNPKEKIVLPYARESSDPFRLLFDFSVVLFVCKLLGITGSIVLGLLTIVGASNWIIVLYSAIILFIFRRVPILRSDLELAKVGIMIASGKNALIAIVVGVILVALTFIVYGFSSVLLTAPANSVAIILTLAVVIFLGLFNVIKYGYSLFHHRTVLSPTLYIWKSIKEGRKFDFLLSKDSKYFESKNIYKGLNLKSKPNIVTICMESYGSIVFRDPDLKQELSAFYNECLSKIKSKGIGVATTLSEPPLFAGGSWLSYTSFTFGIKIADATQYNLLMKNNDAFLSYQSQFRYFKQEGYTNYLLCPLGGDYDDKVDWDSVTKGFASDQYLDWNSMEYKGPRFKYLDLGYSPADQYSLWKANSLIESEKSLNPYNLFFCTLNSHVPYSSPVAAQEDWREINSEEVDMEVTGDAKANLLDKYKRAIQYQMDFVIDFIEKKNDDNTIYTIFGDHQPPFITPKKLGLATPIHVFSKNRKFIESFYNVGWDKGLIPANIEETPMKHEGFYSLFMKALNSSFGINPSVDLPYLPDGIVLSDAQ